MTDGFVRVKGIKIHYIDNDMSQSPRIVMFHGARFNAETWNQVGTLSQLKESGIPGIAVDFPGYGKSERGKWGNLGEFIGDFLDSMGLREPVLLGPSMGGNAVLRYAVNQGKFSGLVLIGPVGVDDLEKDLEKLNGKPVLLIWGSRDTVSPLENAKKIMSSVKSARLEIIGNQHACYLDDPKKFNETLVKFLNDLKWNQN
ncbi:alpha/beta fold hydrolase [Metallosphaera javensis (ex Sakai et al. 2022)]|uniref:alpha/beta fold hydrolase n=1 Tax=Metallosphaera javensis (ex Sakai et al. 2022) TaxID=2775498 RepID=UPI0025885489|nr:MAG: 2-succinyl-6-hydroxy-2,4-cyclohexadiene-1-carboxylate synthase [Metallosphaera javensis (ex Sakai et al. 2022)]